MGWNRTERDGTDVSCYVWCTLRSEWNEGLSDNRNCWGEKLRVHNSSTSVGETIQVNKLLVLHKQNITTQTIKDTLEKL